MGDLTAQSNVPGHTTWLVGLSNWMSSMGPGPAVAAYLCQHVVWPSPGSVAVYAGLVLWNHRRSLFGFFGVAEPTKGAWLAALVGAGLGLIQLRFWRWLLQPRLALAPWSGPGKPLLIPSKTTHSRMFPKKHSFAYSYLLVGVPVGWCGYARGMVSVDVPSSKSWYHIDAADYLERGQGHLGLRGKLDKYLESQGVDPSMYPYAYLVTAAKFCGYHFNPVSFWYLYGPDRELAAMILEVNNTFGERRMYYLLPAESRAVADKDDPSSPGVGIKFTQTWPKDFHVSPFNSRKGSYSITAKDVLSPKMQGPGVVDVTIVLKSSKDHGKLVARIFSDGGALDPTALNGWQKLSFLARWWWVGLVTFPRIVKEAGLLFFARKLHVWYRPEPLKESISREADDTERELEATFRLFLKFYLVEKATSALAVRYYASGTEDTAGDLMVSAEARRLGSWGDDELVLKVLTPVFYTRFVAYAHDLEAFFSELRESNTIWVSKPELLPKLALKNPSPPLQATSYGDYMAFRAIQTLRRRPERIERPLTSSQPTKNQTDSAAGSSITGDLRSFRMSSMDAYVLSSGDHQLKRSYTRAVLRLFVADRITFGMVPLLDALISCLRAATACAAAYGTNKLIG